MVDNDAKTLSLTNGNKTGLICYELVLSAVKTQYNTRPCALLVFIDKRSIYDNTV